MKKFIRFSALFSTIALFAISCSTTDDITSTPTDNRRYVTFVTEALNSPKTVFGDKSGEKYPTLWTNTDKIHVSTNGESWPVESTVEPSADGRTAQFGAEVSVPFSGSVRYFAVSPSSCYSYFYAYDKEYDFTVPVRQTSSQDSCDPAAQILLARSELVTVDSDYVPLHFEHMTAYGKFSVKNLSVDAGAIKSVTIKAQKSLTGGYGLYWTEATPRISDFGGDGQVVITTSSTDNIWFGCMPADLSGTLLDVTVVTENGDYKKSIDLTGKTLAFKAGEVSEFSIDMAGIEPPKAAGKIMVGGESIPCMSAVIGYDFGSWSKSMIIYIGEVVGSTTNEIESGRYLSLDVNLEDVADLSNFSIKDQGVYIMTDPASYSSYSSTYCVGTASVVMADGQLKFEIKDAMIPEGWSSNPTMAFSASYEGSYTEECTSYNTSSVRKDVNDNYDYYYGVNKLFVNNSAGGTVFMLGNDSSVVSAADIKNGECGIKISIADGDEGKVIDVANSQSKVVFYDYEAGTTHVALSGSLIYVNINGITPYIYCYVYFDAEEDSYLEIGISCDAVLSEDVDLTPAAK